MSNFSKLFLLLLLSLTIHNCDNDDTINQNDDNTDLNTNDLVFQNENFGTTTTGNFIGHVKNENGENLSNVQITIGNVIIYTDQNGFFISNGVEVFENFAYIEAYKDGYVKGSRVVVPKTDGFNRINIVLLEKEVTATVNSGESTTVSLQNGSKVTFTGNFITQEGNPYDGQVEIVSHYLKPNRASTFIEMPGSLFAQTSTNNAVGLETYGMLSVILLSPSGEELNIDENTPAIIEFPIDITQTDIAPEVMSLWYFDETVGYWKEQGVATKNENKYIGEVTHFTWWNCDLPIDFVNLCLTINATDTDFAIPYNVNITRVTNNQLIYSGTMLSGVTEECGLIPQNEETKVSIHALTGDCSNTLIHEEVIGGLNSNSSVNISFSEDIQTTLLTGSVTDCSDNPLTNGYVFIDENNAFSVTDGIINFGVQYCNSYTKPIQIFDFDAGQLTVVNDVNFTGASVNLGSLSTCENIGDVYNGDVHLKNQSEVDNFGLFNYSSINGYLRISNDDASSNIHDLTPLNSLESITGYVSVTQNPLLENLNGLNNVVNIGSNLQISGNTNITSLTGLDNLASVGNLQVTFNQNLATTNGLNSLVNIGSGLRIANNEALVSIESFENITNLITLKVRGNSSLTTLNGFGNLIELNGLYIHYNNALTSLVGFEQITQLGNLEISGNQSLTNLDGLQNLITFTNIGSQYFPALLIGFERTDTGFETGPCPNLTNYCALENLFINGNGTSIEYLIENNAYNPSSQDIIDGNCSQ
ncbi:hypothetical protein [Psychroserpens sp. Hel_I_66]|uniref:hypothetical protein n=1 Tax=Psychroserpens sp. Hel_I_66 TaxID=1250004 RepID=UPI00064591D0|nr:hypothetical protein [Psychroserpens sp. Hel_I_66]